MLVPCFKHNYLQRRQNQTAKTIQLNLQLFGLNERNNTNLSGELSNVVWNTHHTEEKQSVKNLCLNKNHNSKVKTVKSVLSHICENENSFGRTNNYENRAR